jgi:hypothetical protein
MRLGDNELVRVYAKHEPYEDGHLGDVVIEMMERGAPIIKCVEWRGELFAIEGSHRLAAAHYLGLYPILVVEVPSYLDPIEEEFWEVTKATLPHYAWLVEPDA